jgi:hypothetical protein
MEAFPATRLDLDWAAERVDITFSPRAQGIAALDASGCVRGVVVFDSWTPTAAQLHVALDTPIALRCLLTAGFGYVFRQEGRRLLWMLVNESRSHAVHLAREMGFREAHRVRQGESSDLDIILFEMRREECRWLKGGKHG